MSGVTYGKLFCAVIHHPFTWSGFLNEVCKTRCTWLRTRACSHEGTRASAHTCEAGCARGQFSQARSGGWGGE